MSQAAVEHYLNEFARLQFSSPEWLNSVRQSALAAFRQTGFPTLRHEDWKYTDIRPILKGNFITTDAAANGISQDHIENLSFRKMDCHELVFINGNFSSSLSSIDKLPGDAVLTSIHDAMKNNTAFTQTYLDKYSNAEKNAFAALNTAFITDGACLHAPDNVLIEKPVHLLFLADASSHVAHIRNLIVLGKNAKATVIETYAGTDEKEYFTNTITEVETGAGAALEHYKLQQEGLKGYHVGNLQASQQQDSRLESHSISLGGALVRNNIDSDLHEQGAHIIMNGLYMAAGRQHIDNHTCVNHSKPHTASEEYYRGVLDGQARGVFNGKVIVHKQAQKTDAHQSNANLLLSDKAEVDTKPELEIYADDVKCSHGATVGQLDENMLFYLRSRAIEAETAKSLLTFAFADEVINRIKFTPIRERLETKVVGKLPDKDLISDFIK